LGFLGFKACTSVFPPGDKCDKEKAVSLGKIQELNGKLNSRATELLVDHQTARDKKPAREKHKKQHGHQSQEQGVGS
jgi:hypothetical protein